MCLIGHRAVGGTEGEVAAEVADPLLHANKASLGRRCQAVGNDPVTLLEGNGIRIRNRRQRWNRTVCKGESNDLSLGLVTPAVLLNPKDEANPLVGPLVERV